MGKAHPMELRSRVIAFVEEGHGHREAARHFRVSPRFVNDMVILKRESGGLLPKVQGNHAEGKLAPFATWLRERLAVKGDLTLDEIVAEMAAVHGVTVHRASVGRWLHRLGLSHRKTLLGLAKSCGLRWRSGAGSGSKPASLTWPTCWKL
jgi:transposase